MVTLIPLSRSAVTKSACTKPTTNVTATILEIAMKLLPNWLPCRTCRNLQPIEED